MTKGRTNPGAMPAKVSDKVRATVTAGLAKLVEDVKKYAPPMYAPTAKGTTEVRLVRTRARISSSSPNVATTSLNHSAPELRAFEDTSTRGSENMAFATIAPRQPPTTWATT